MKIIKSPSARIALAFAATLALPQLSLHAEFWIGTAATGNWSLTTNWSATNGGVTNNTLPPAGDFVSIILNDAIAHTVNYDLTNNLTYGNILLTQTGTGNLVFQKLTTNTLTVNSMDIGTSGKASFINPGGNVAISGYLKISEGSTVTASVTASGGNINLGPAATFIVGFGGNGTFNQSGGNVNAPSVSIAPNAGATGAYDLSSGILTITGDVTVGGHNTGNATFAQTGGTANISGNLTIDISSSASLANGTLAANVINLHTFSHFGGSLGSGLTNTTFTNYGTFIGSSTNNPINFDQFINYGTITVDDAYVFSGGFTNFSTQTVDTGHTFTVNTQPFDNEQQLNLSGGTISVQNALVNNAQFSATGNITGNGSLINNGILSLVSALNLNNASLGFNNGNLDVANFQLRLNGAGFINSASITLSGGSITGAQQLTNSTAGTIAGAGLISAPFTNNGTLFAIGGALNISSAFVSTGTIQLGSPTASLIGGAINNFGNIIGNGSLGSPLTNNGSIDPTGGTLILNGALINNATLSASTGNKLLAKNFSVNPGIISLAGGTFDNGNNPLNNTGQISGYGVLNTGGLTNNGTFTLTGGTTTINGNVTNSAGKLLLVEFNPVVFTGHVTNNGIVKTTNTTVTFAGPYTENGTFSSDPATETFSDVDIGTTGAWQGGQGDKFIVTGHFITHSTANTTWNTDQAELSLQGGTTHTLSLNSSPTAGFSNNFAWGILTLALGDSLTLQNGDLPNDTALFLHTLNLPGGLAQLANISGQPNQKIFYDPSNPANAYLSDQTYTLTGNALLTPVPEPTTLSLLAIPLLLVKRRKQK